MNPWYMDMLTFCQACCWFSSHQYQMKCRYQMKGTRTGAQVYEFKFQLLPQTSDVTLGKLLVLKELWHPMKYCMQNTQKSGWYIVRTQEVLAIDTISKKWFLHQNFGVKVTPHFPSLVTSLDQFNLYKSQQECKTEPPLKPSSPPLTIYQTKTSEGFLVPRGF